MPSRRSFTHRVHRPASIRIADADQGKLAIIFTTGADVHRRDVFGGASYVERLLTGPENVRLDRMNLGAPFLDTHDAYALGSVIGSVVPGSARMESGKGLCDVLLSQSARAADTVRDILDGVIRNISVGNDVHAFTRIDASDGCPAVMVATDWEPMEVSAVPIPADPGARIAARTRSAAGLEVHTCVVTQADQSKETIMVDALNDAQRGLQWAARLRRREVDLSEMARLADKPAVDETRFPSDTVAVERARAQQVYDRAFPGRSRSPRG